MLDWLINRDVANSRLGITIYDDGTDKIIYRNEKYHGNFFNGSITARKIAHLREVAADWARKNGHDTLAELLEKRD